jgi:uncharacterized protein YciI
VIAAALLTLTLTAGGAQAPPGFDTYLLALLYRGESSAPADASAGEVQKAHLQNLNRMWAEGLLLASGPIGDDGDLRGVLVLKGERPAIEARFADDPLIKSGRLRVVLTPWMGPEEIGAGYRRWRAENPDAADKMRTYQLVLMRPAPTAAPLNPAEQFAHLKHMQAMVSAGQLMVAGPVTEPGDLAGIFVFDTDAFEADKLAASDPAVTSKKMLVERHPWMVAEQVLPKGFKVPLP